MGNTSSVESNNLISKNILEDKHLFEKIFKKASLLYQKNTSDFLDPDFCNKWAITYSKQLYQLPIQSLTKIHNKIYSNQEIDIPVSLEMSVQYDPLTTEKFLVNELSGHLIEHFKNKNIPQSKIEKGIQLTFPDIQYISNKTLALLNNMNKIEQRKRMIIQNGGFFLSGGKKPFKKTFQKNEEKKDNENFIKSIKENINKVITSNNKNSQNNNQNNQNNNKSSNTKPYNNVVLLNDPVFNNNNQKNNSSKNNISINENNSKNNLSIKIKEKFKRNNKENTKSFNNQPIAVVNIENEKPRNEILENEKPRNEKPKNEKPKNEKPRNEKPKFEKPRVEKPKFEKIEKPRIEKFKVEPKSSELCIDMDKPCKLTKKQICDKIVYHFMVRNNLIAAIVNVIPFPNTKGEYSGSFTFERLKSLLEGKYCLPPFFDQIKNAEEDVRISKILKFINLSDTGSCSEQGGFILKLSKEKLNELKNDSQLGFKYMEFTKKINLVYQEKLLLLHDILEQLETNKSLNTNTLNELSKRVKFIIDDLHLKTQFNYLMAILIVLDFDFIKNENSLSRKQKRLQKIIKGNFS